MANQLRENMNEYCSSNSDSRNLQPMDAEDQEAGSILVALAKHANKIQPTSTAEKVIIKNI